MSNMEDLFSVGISPLTNFEFAFLFRSKRRESKYLFLIFVTIILSVSGTFSPVEAHSPKSKSHKDLPYVAGEVLVVISTDTNLTTKARKAKFLSGIKSAIPGTIEKSIFFFITSQSGIQS